MYYNMVYTLLSVDLLDLYCIILHSVVDILLKTVLPLCVSEK